MADEKYVLAMYDVRGKQEFVFRTNKLKEIVGGSWIIRDVFNDYLFPAAEEISESENGIFYYKDKNGRPKTGCEFKKSSFKQHIEEYGYIGEVVYDGGGNFFVLFKDEDTFRKVTNRFTGKLMQEVGTLRVLGTCVEVDLPDDREDDYRRDDKKLHAKHRENEMQESIIAPWACLPIVQVDRATSQPLVYTEKDDRKDLPDQIRYSGEKYSKECLAKLTKFYSVINSDTQTGGNAERYFNQNEKNFDKLVSQKGEDSQLAVIYIDGNNMGAKVQSCLGENKTYEDCVKALRDFSEEIQKIYIDDGVQAAMEGKDSHNEHRIVIYAGDEVNFVVNAHDAYSCAKSYLKSLPQGHSACAGIAVFHSHSPYSEAYRIAEECCESGKQQMKKRNISEACLIDFHICQGAIGTSLEQIREDENGEGVSRPWILSDGKDKTDMNGEALSSPGISSDDDDGTDITKISDVEYLAGMFRKLGRTNVKDLADRAMKGVTELSMELQRIWRHQKDKKRSDLKIDWEWIGIDDGESDLAMVEEKRWLIYDVVNSFDLWFKEEETQNKLTGQQGGEPA